MDQQKLQCSIYFRQSQKSSNRNIWAKPDFINHNVKDFLICVPIVASNHKKTSYLPTIHSIHQIAIS